MEIWQPKPPGILRATPGLLWDSFTFTLTMEGAKIYGVISEEAVVRCHLCENFTYHKVHSVLV